MIISGDCILRGREKDMQEYKPYKSGKVREVYDIGDSLIMVATDRISAFDHILKNKITDKGAVLTRMSAFWFNYTKDLIPNHMLSMDPADMPVFFRSEEYAGKSMKVKKLTMLPLECIVRGYITGSGWASYKDISYEQSVEVLEKEFPGHGAQYAKELRDKTLALYNRCADYALTRGIIIADTKFEFGLDEEGNIVLADEMLTPDSSRFWPVEGYETGHGQPSYDKQYVRDWLKANPDSDYLLPQEVIDRTVDKYKEAFRLLTGQEF